MRNQTAGASRTYVACQGARVVAFYSLANGAIAHREASGRLRRNMRDPIPVMLLGRLAVDREFQGRGLGKALLQDAILRTLQAAEIAGIRAILVHAKDENARRFYERYGFLASPANPRTLALPLQECGGAVEVMRSATWPDAQRRSGAMRQKESPSDHERLRYDVDVRRSMSWI
ncbi:MAG TPA: GNAT family N-acetyltransferase [Geminicoccaceae bacterium]|nr:GNAT family N-acetyltransferase [Geminicoccaceae bacterium]